VKAAERQAFALAHPLGRADGDPADLLPLRHDRKHATGLILRTILAVDR
jgi:hypothetical protein